MRRGWRLVPLALLLMTVLEISAFALVGRAIGFGWTVLLILAASVAGLLLLRREGMRAWRGFRSAAEAGRPPGAQVTDGLIGLLAGLLLAMPGLVSGVLGLLLTVPPVRRLARRRAQVAAERRVSAAVAGDLFGPRRVRVRRGESQPAQPPPTGPAQPSDAEPGAAIEGEIVEPRRTT
ncbi:FxsA family protein [Solwaraspora sp. WMMD1047]|uniref:FxsA family protein n=1 Tax=Solwaraspora sp. WMMD1047 TaxID=3016102 RepID=UPI002416E3EB|nr:FxsA family protein [Solwaraspora sp. WMMD1047]MDG4831087.1 FxsA family protein [Solwaraspora sp. WMMD1047]